MMRHKWRWIVSGYARECLRCGFTEYIYSPIKKDKGIQILQGGFPVGSAGERRKIPKCYAVERNLK